MLGISLNMHIRAATQHTIYGWRRLTQLLMTNARRDRPQKRKTSIAPLKSSCAVRWSVAAASFDAQQTVEHFLFAVSGLSAAWAIVPPPALCGIDMKGSSVVGILDGLIHGWCAEGMMKDCRWYKINVGRFPKHRNRDTALERGGLGVMAPKKNNNLWAVDRVAHLEWSKLENRPSASRRQSRILRCWPAASKLVERRAYFVSKTSTTLMDLNWRSICASVATSGSKASVTSEGRSSIKSMAHSDRSLDELHFGNNKRKTCTEPGYLVTYLLCAAGLKTKARGDGGALEASGKVLHREPPRRGLAHPLWSHSALNSIFACPATVREESVRR
ncbi:hypothetical protein V8E36_009592 [Tilletia maclaganii]